MGCTDSKTEDDRNAAGQVALEDIGYEQQVEAAAGIIGGVRDISTRVQLSISCQGIADVDRGSLTDPFCVAFTRSNPNVPWAELKRTEIIANTLNPEWVTLVPMSYHFEELQMIRMEVYDVSGSFSTSSAEDLVLQEQVYLGCLEFALAQVLSMNNKVWSTPLVNAPELTQQNATMKIQAEEVANRNGTIMLHLRAHDVEANPKPSLFVRLSRQLESGGLLPFFKTETRKSSEPVWDQITTTLQQVANGDIYRPIIFEVFAWQASGEHALLGSCQACVDDLIRMSSSEQPLQIVDSNMQQHGTLVCSQCIFEEKPTFFNSAFGQGMEINAVVAIDFTASNGQPNLLDSLHYYSPADPNTNQYAQAISGIGNVIQFYDSDKLYPVFGFGCKLGPGQPASHLFAVNGNEQNPEVEGVEGILRCYHEALGRVELSGPTIFTPVISQAAAMAASTKSTDPCSQQYFILLIITDGIINDMRNTIDAIVEASTLPLSIIIVGVGDTDFSAMETLDGDDVPLRSSHGVQIARDIVQFVPMKQFLNRGPHAFAKEVLAEVPFQLVSYMEANGIPAPPPRTNTC